MHLVDIINGGLYCDALRTALWLRLFDSLDAAPIAAPELARLLRVPLRPLKALLELLVALQLIEESPEGYRNGPEASQCLVHGKAGFRGEGIEYFAGKMVPKLIALSEKVFSGEIPDIGPEFECEQPTPPFYASEADAIYFSGFAAPGAMEAGGELAERFDFTPYADVVDLGGNNGTFLVPILKKYPKLVGTVVDLPMLRGHVERTRDVFSVPNLRFEGRDFFKDSLPPADCYVCGHVFHDWHDAIATRILRKIHDALPPGGTFIACENILDDPDSNKRLAFATSNYFIVSGTFGSTYAHGEKTSEEYSKWLEENGFILKKIIWGEVRAYLHALKVP